MTLNTIENTMDASVRETFSGFLGLEMDDPVERDIRSEGESVLSACIPFIGSWRGALVVTATTRFVSDAAARAFACADPDDELLADVIGEISNIVAGNFTSALPNDVELSIPIVVRGSDFQAGIPRGKIVRRFAYAAAGEPVCVTLMRSEGEQ